MYVGVVEVELVSFLNIFCLAFSQCFIRVVHPYRRIDTIAAWKKPCFILLDNVDFHMIDNLCIVVHDFQEATHHKTTAVRLLTSLL